jgi:hypothetical protein
MWPLGTLPELPAFGQGGICTVRLQGVARGWLPSTRLLAGVMSEATQPNDMVRVEALSHLGHSSTI